MAGDAAGREVTGDPFGPWNEAAVDRAVRESRFMAEGWVCLQEEGAATGAGAGAGAGAVTGVAARWKVVMGTGVKKVRCCCWWRRDPW